MLDFLRKEDVWNACDEGYLENLESKISYQLKTAQDLAILCQLSSFSNLKIGEIGGGDSRVLKHLALRNQCFNIERFEGKHLGPNSQVNIDNVINIDAYVGDFNPHLLDSFFDIIFSISVVEHVETSELEKFFKDSLRILKPGGIFLHVIDLYLEDEPSFYLLERFNIYRSWVHGNKFVTPLGKVFDGQPKFQTNMISNPDHILYGWNKLVPSLATLRSKAQNVALLVAGLKVDFKQ